MTVIAFEGIDHSGKSTQIRHLKQALHLDHGIESVVIRFPSRETPTGQLLDGFLKGDVNIESIQAAHLLFTANRWEKQAEISRLIDRNVVVILDRYKSSGIAYSVAKGLSMTWCIDAEASLLDPDLTILLHIDPNDVVSRSGYGDEIHDTMSLQNAVSQAYNDLFVERSWCKIDAKRPPEQIHREIIEQLQNRGLLNY